MTGRERSQPCRQAQLITYKELSSQSLSLLQRNPPASPHPATSQLTTHSTRHLGSSPAAEQRPQSPALKAEPSIWQGGSTQSQTPPTLPAGARGTQGRRSPAGSSSVPPGAQREGPQAARCGGCLPAAGSRRLSGSHADSTSLLITPRVLPCGKVSSCFALILREKTRSTPWLCVGQALLFHSSSGHPSPLPPPLDFPFTRSQPNPCPFQLYLEAASSINRILCSSLRGVGNKQH